MGYKDIKEFFDTYKDDPKKAFFYLAILLVSLVIGYIFQHFVFWKAERAQTPDDKNRQIVMVQPLYNSSSSLKPPQTSSDYESPKGLYYNKMLIGSWLIDQQETEKRCIHESGKRANLDPAQIESILYYSQSNFSLPYIKPIRDTMVADFRIKISANLPQNLIVRFTEPNLKSPTFYAKPLQTVDRIEFATSEKKFFYIDLINKEVLHESIMLSGNLSDLKNLSQISKLPCALVILNKERDY